MALGAAVAADGVTDTEATLGLPFEPLPFSDATTGRCAASVIIARLPFTAPSACAENFTEKLCVWFGARVVGVVSPEMVNPVPVTIAWLMLKLVVPMFVTPTV